MECGGTIVNKDQIRFHPTYGGPLYLIKIIRLQVWALIIVFVFAIFCTIGYFHQLPTDFKGWKDTFLLLFVLSMWGVLIYGLTLDREDIRLILYENGIWSHHNIIGTTENFIPWCDITFFEEKSYTIRWSQFLAIVIHLNNREEYDRRVSVGEKALYCLERHHLGSYQFLITNNRLDISQRQLYELLTQELENWRNRQEGVQ